MGCSKMAECDITGCDGDSNLRYTCNECNGTFCTDHRLPESHNCSALRTTNFGDGDQKFATGLQDKQEKKSGITSRSEKTRFSSKYTSTPTKIQSSSQESTNFEDSQAAGNTGESTRDNSSEVDDTGELSVLSRVRVRLVSVLMSAFKNLSKRLRPFLAWVWWVLTGVVRLTGAAATLWGIGWVLLSVVHVPASGPVQILTPGLHSVLLTVVGIILVEGTARLHRS